MKSGFNMSYTVYMHKFPNGKVYIGVTRQELSRRWRDGKGYQGQPVFDAIVKYGWDNIEHVILECGLTKEQAEEAEKAYIKKYDSLSHANGYNIETGGYLTEFVSEETRQKISRSKKGKYSGKNHWHYGQHWSEDVKRKLSIAHKGKKMSEKERARRIGMFSGEKNPMYGTKMPKGHLEKMIEASKKTNCKPVICIETGIEYESSAEAQRQTGICARGISLVCNKDPRYKKAGGYHWRYVSEVS